METEVSNPGGKPVPASDREPRSAEEDAQVVQAMIDNDVEKLRKLRDNGATVGFYQYSDALKKTNGRAIQNTALVKWLHETGELSAHQILLDSAAGGNLELLKFAESLGEDVTYYKAYLLSVQLTNPMNPCRRYIEARLKAQNKWHPPCWYRMMCSPITYVLLPATIVLTSAILYRYLWN